MVRGSHTSLQLLLYFTAHSNGRFLAMCSLHTTFAAPLVNRFHANPQDPPSCPGLYMSLHFVFSPPTSLLFPSPQVKRPGWMGHIKVDTHPECSRSVPSLRAMSSKNPWVWVLSFIWKIDLESMALTTNLHTSSLSFSTFLHYLTVAYNVCQETDLFAQELLVYKVRFFPAFCQTSH